MLSTEQQVTQIPVHASDELWQVAVRASASGGLSGGNPYLDKLTLAINEQIEDTFNLSNNFNPARKLKTLSLAKPKPTIVKVGGQQLKIPDLGGGLTFKDGKPVLTVPLIGYDYRLGDGFDADKALAGAKSFARKFVKDNSSLVQNALFPKKLDKLITGWVKGLPAPIRDTVGKFAEQVYKHGKDSVRVILSELAQGDTTHARKLLDKELKGLQKDFDTFTKSAGNTALKAVGKNVLDAVATATGNPAIRKIQVPMPGSKEGWQVSLESSLKAFGVPVPHLDGLIADLNETIQDTFNLLNNLAPDQHALDVVLDENAAAVAQSVAVNGGDVKDDEASGGVGQLSFTLNR